MQFLVTNALIDVQPHDKQKDHLLKFFDSWVGLNHQRLG